jgi:hypothetical protein
MLTKTIITHRHITNNFFEVTLKKNCEPILNLRTFDEGLTNKKHVQILESLKDLVNKCFVNDKGL